MTESTATSSLLNRIANQRIILLFLLGLSCFIALARFHTYNEPLEHDITATAVIANEMRAGRPYYSDVWENKPPALYIAHIAGQYLFGYGRGYLYALNVSLALISLFGVYVAASSLGMGRTAGLWAAVFWTLISGDMDLQANQPNTEASLNATLIWAFALFLRPRCSFIPAITREICFGICGLRLGCHICIPNHCKSFRRWSFSP